MLIKTWQANVRDDVDVMDNQNFYFCCSISFLRWNLITLLIQSNLIEFFSSLLLFCFFFFSFAVVFLFDANSALGQCFDVRLCVWYVYFHMILRVMMSFISPMWLGRKQEKKNTNISQLLEQTIAIISRLKTQDSRLKIHSVNGSNQFDLCQCILN